MVSRNFLLFPKPSTRKPWDCNVPEYKLKDLYGSWGTFFLKNHKIDKAVQYFDKSDKYGFDEKLLRHRSVGHRLLGHADVALRYSAKAAEINPHPFYKMEVLQCLYESNQLSNAAVYAQDAAQHSDGRKSHKFHEMASLIATNFEDCLGESLTPFITRNREVFATAMDHVQSKRMKKVERPLWKVLKEQNQCDNVSVIELKTSVIRPIERERQKLDYKIYSQTYFNMAWRDIEFLRNLNCEPNVNAPFYHISGPQLQDIIYKENKTIGKYLKMLHTRWPMYNRKFNQFYSREQENEQRVKHLNRMQQHIRRITYNILRKVKKYSLAGDIQKLRDYIEETMGGFANLRTYRMLPWKMEFLNDICNSLGLAIIEKLENPQYIERVSLNCLPRHRLTMLLSVKRNSDPPRDADIYVMERKHLEFVNFIAQRENRKPFTEYSIERAYLDYELSRYFLLHNQLVESISYANKGLEEAKECKSNLWQFLNVLQLIRINASLNKTRKLSILLEEAKRLSELLGSDKVIAYVDMCEKFNNDNIEKWKNSVKNSIKKTKRSSVQSYILKQMDSEFRFSETLSNQVNESRNSAASTLHENIV